MNRSSASTPRLLEDRKLRACHRPLVNAHEVILLELYRAVDVSDRAAVDLLLWSSFLRQAPRPAMLARERRLQQARRSFKSGNLLWTRMAEFKSYWWKASGNTDTRGAR